MKIKVYGCPSVKRELYLLAAFSKNETEIEIVPHGITQQQLQQKIDQTKADRIVLAMGACRTVGLHSKSVPLTVPQVHDCVSLLLGSAERYRKIFSENEDSPVWVNTEECRHAAKRGQRCAVMSGFLPNDAEKLPENTKQYISDLSLLKSLLDMTFDDTQAVIVPQNSRIISDPVEIISFEPL